MWRRLAARITSKRKAIAPIKDTTRATVAWLQNLPNTSHTFFHRTCEFPLKPITPMAVVAPLAEKSRPTITASRVKMISPGATLLFPPRFARARTRESAAYAHATAFATTKYLNQIAQ